MDFNIGDSVEWSVNGKVKTGEVVEIVKAGNSPSHRIYRKTVTAKRNHKSYVVKSGGDYIWPKGVLSTIEPVSLPTKRVALLSEASVSKKVASKTADDYIAHLETVVIALTKSHLFNKELFDRPQGRGFLFSQVDGSDFLDPLYGLKSPNPDVSKSIKFVSERILES